MDDADARDAGHVCLVQETVDLVFGVGGCFADEVEFGGGVAAVDVDELGFGFWSFGLSSAGCRSMSFSLRRRLPTRTSATSLSSFSMMPTFPKLVITREPTARVSLFSLVFS